ncbi:hypothetical protein [Faecalispora anaeroviscerum]|uniref:hypothetical protein n=1 Tax=Faecalispora anaeroviscerum TaxID=2991836 RepID=UPI0024B8CBB5|nr:hypothetical protein [Faecalispora anaeroviscerum]
MAAADREKVTEKVQTALPSVSPDQVNDLVDQAEEYFLAKTGRRSVPDRAARLWSDLAVQISKAGLAANGQQVVSSIKRGNTTVEYDSAGSSGGGLSGIDARIALFKVAKII